MPFPLTFERTLPIWWSFIWRQTAIGGLIGGALGFVGGYLAAVAGSPQYAASIGALAGWLSSIPVSIWAIRASLLAHKVRLKRESEGQDATASLTALTFEQSLILWWSFVWRAGAAAIPVCLGLGGIGGLLVGFTGNPQLGAPVGMILGWLGMFPVSMWAFRAALTKHEVDFSAKPQKVFTVGLVSGIGILAIDDSNLWASALQEYESTSRNAGVYARLYAEFGGEEAKVKAAYLKIRVAQYLRSSGVPNVDSATDVKGSSAATKEEPSNAPLDLEKPYRNVALYVLSTFVVLVIIGFAILLTVAPK
jgi:hypothetical protein